MQTHLGQAGFPLRGAEGLSDPRPAGPARRDLVEQWIGADIAASLPGRREQPSRARRCARTCTRLLEYPLATVALNGPLVRAGARHPDAPAAAELRLQPDACAARSCSRCRSGRSPTTPGRPAARVFELRDGKPLNTGMPGIFTWNGYHTVFLPLLPRRHQGRHRGRLGARPPQARRPGRAAVGEMNQLRRDVLGLYLDDYTRRWDAMLANIALKPFGEPRRRGSDELYLLSAPESPLRDLLQAVDTQTQLSRPAATEQAARRGGGQGGQGRARALAGFGALPGARRPDRPSEAQVGDDPRRGVRQRLRDRQAGRSGAAGGRAFPRAARVRRRRQGQAGAARGGDRQDRSRSIKGMSQAANAPNQGPRCSGCVAGSMRWRGGGGGGRGAAAQLQELAQSVPKPVGRMLQAVSQSSRAGDGERGEPAARRRLELEGLSAVPGRVQPLPVRRQQRAGRAAGRLRRACSARAG